MIWFGTIGNQLTVNCREYLTLHHWDVGMKAHKWQINTI